jgi:hypothetical protein
MGQLEVGGGQQVLKLPAVLVGKGCFTFTFCAVCALLAVCGTPLLFEALFTCITAVAYLQASAGVPCLHLLHMLTLPTPAHYRQYGWSHGRFTAA